MINTLNTSVTIIIFFVSFVIVFFILSLFLTKKFNYKLRKFYSIFFGLSFRETLLEACIITNFLLGLYFICNIDKINSGGLMMVAVVNVLAIFISFNVHTIFANIIYSSISVGLLWLLSVVYDYYKYMQNDTVLYLIIAFMLLIAIYFIFVTIRMIGIIVSKHQKMLKG